MDDNDGTVPHTTPDPHRPGSAQDPAAPAAGAPRDTDAGATSAGTGQGATSPGYPPAGGYPAPGQYGPHPGQYGPPPDQYGPPPGPYAPPGQYAPPADTGPGAYPPPADTGPGAYPPPAATAPRPDWSARRLTRSRTDRMVGGVCGGLARYWNTDPVLLRILTVVLTVFTGGAFLVVYLIALIVIPEDPAAPSGTTPAPAAQGAPQGYAAGGAPPYAGYAPTTADPLPPAPRERSYLGWLVLSAALLVAGVLGLIGFLVPASAQMWGIVGGVTLAIIGLGLLVGARYGRARWLVIPAIPLAFLTFVAVAAGNWVQQNPNWDRWIESPGSSSRPWGGLTVGDRYWTVGPADVTGSPLVFRLTAGDATLDLTPLARGTEDPEPTDPVRVSVDAGVGLGTLDVVVPADVRVELRAEVGAGTIDLPGESVRDGTGLDVRSTIDSLSGTPTYIIELDAAIGAGDLEVRREAA